MSLRLISESYFVESDSADSGEENYNNGMVGAGDLSDDELHVGGTKIQKGEDQPSEMEALSTRQSVRSRSPSRKNAERTSENDPVEIPTVQKEIRPKPPTRAGSITKGGKCHRCGVYLKDPSRLWKHMEMHSEVGRPWKCSKCCSFFITKRNLRHHENARHGTDDEFWRKCRICNLKFSFRSAHEDHVKIHEETSRPFKCTQCPSFYLTSSQLRIHENRVHGREAGVSKTWCRICNKEFRFFEYASHMRIHEDTNRPWKCSQCPSFFQAWFRLRIHENQCHNRKPGKTLWSCEMCGKVYPPHKLINHIKSAHRTPANLKLQQVPSPPQETTSSWQELLSQIQLRPCKLVLERCDDLLPTSVTEVWPTHAGSNISCSEVNGSSCDTIAKVDVLDTAMAPAQRIYTCPYCFIFFDAAGLLISHLPIHTDCQHNKIQRKTREHRTQPKSVPKEKS